jgi:hypothetical protein
LIRGEKLQILPLPLLRGGLGRGHSWIFARGLMTVFELKTQKEKLSEAT